MPSSGYIRPSLAPHFAPRHARLRNYNARRLENKKLRPWSIEAAQRRVEEAAALAPLRGCYTFKQHAVTEVFTRLQTYKPNGMYVEAREKNIEDWKDKWKKGKTKKERIGAWQKLNNLESLNHGFWPGRWIVDGNELGPDQSFYEIARLVVEKLISERKITVADSGSVCAYILADEQFTMADAGALSTQRAHSDTSTSNMLPFPSSTTDNIPISTEESPDYTSEFDGPQLAFCGHQVPNLSSLMAHVPVCTVCNNWMAVTGPNNPLSPPCGFLLLFPDDYWPHVDVCSNCQGWLKAGRSMLVALGIYEINETTSAN